MAARKLITESDIREAAQAGRTSLAVRPGVVVTPLARDAARSLGVALDLADSCSCAADAAHTVAVGSDHGGFEYKEALIPFIRALGWEVLDVGTHDTSSCDYPEYAYAVASAVRDGNARLGIMIDGAGPGSAIACNKVPGIRAACIHDEFTAWNARAHNDAHIATLGSRAVGMEVCKRAVRVFLESTFEGGRHSRRVDKITDIEARYGAGSGLARADT